MKIKKGIIFILALLCSGCSSSIIELKYPYKTSGDKRPYKLYISDFKDSRPAEETNFALADNVKANPVFIPLPDFAFDPAPPAEFLKNTLTAQLKQNFEIVTTLDSADFYISGELAHFSIFKTPSDAVRLSQKITLLSGFWLKRLLSSLVSLIPNRC